MSSEQSPNKIGKSVGEKIRAARVALHYTQSKLASPDFSVSYISAIERGQIHPSLRALEILAARLGLSTTELLPKRPQQDDAHMVTSPQPQREDNEEEMILLDVLVRISQNEPAKALALLGKVSAKRLKRPQQLWHRYLFGYAQFLLHQFKDAEHIFSELTQIAKDANNTYLHTHILIMLGNTFAAMDNPTQALLAYQRCLNALEEAQACDVFLMARTYTQLGIAYTALEQLNNALVMFHNALDTLAQLQDAQQVQAVYAMLSQAAIDNQDYYAAELYSYQAIAHSEKEMQIQLKGNIYHYLSQAILQGASDEAYNQLFALKEKEKSNALIQASIDTRLSEWFFAHQNVQKARSFAEDACTLASPFGETRITANALVVLGRIEYAQQAFDTGDEHFVQGLTMLEHLHQQAEFKEQSLQYAHLLEERGMAHEAFTYFRRAYQSRM